MECVCNVLHRRAFCTCTKWNKTEKIINFESRERSECTCRANICCLRFMPRRVIHLKACLSCARRFFNSQHICCHHMAASASSSTPFPCRTAHAECFVSITKSFRYFQFSSKTKVATSLTFNESLMWLQNSHSRKVYRGFGCGWTFWSCWVC